MLHPADALTNFLKSFHRVSCGLHVYVKVSKCCYNCREIFLEDNGLVKLFSRDFIFSWPLKSVFSWTMYITSSNQRLWECFRRRNFNTDTWNDFLIWLSASIYCWNRHFSSTSMVLQKDISVCPCHSNWRGPGTNYNVRCIAVRVSVDSQI